MSARALPVLLAFDATSERLSESGIAAWLTRGNAGVIAAVFALSSVAAQAAAGSQDASVISILWKWTPFLASGFEWNIVISVVAMATGTLAGFVLGVALTSDSALLRRPSWFSTQILRNSPWLVLLFYCMYLLPFRIHVFGSDIPMPDWLKASFGFALPVTAYVAEIVRGAIQSIPLGQWESAEALAFGRRQTIWLIILPQCLKRMLPAWMNLYAFVAMSTVLANIVGVTEALTATRQALDAEGKSALLLPMYGYILLWFFAYCYPIARLTVSLERRWMVVAY